MKLSIRWELEAIYTRDQVYEYLVRDWSVEIADEFILKLDDLILQIADGNVQYQWFEEGQCYQVPVTKQNTLYYEINGSVLHLLTVWDTRQDPTKLLL